MPSPQVSVVVPCYNEADNVALLVSALDTVLKEYHWEVIFVDDNSPDGTMVRVHELALEDSRVRGIHRIGRRGLSSAVIEGILSSSASVVAVMDGDLQHDERCLPDMLASILSRECDLAVASRYVEGGANDGLSNVWRRVLSNGGIWAAQKLLSVSLRDPMSGFFAIRRSCFEERAAFLSGEGFKILLDIVMAKPEALSVREFPMVFRDRVHGESKLGASVMLSFARMVLKEFRNRHPLLVGSATGGAIILFIVGALSCLWSRVGNDTEN